MEVGQGPNVGCSAKGKKKELRRNCDGAKLGEKKSAYRILAGKLEQ
jgi:hypothetical protein